MCASYKKNFSFRTILETSICLAVLPRENSAWRTFFRSNSANSNHGSEYSDWSTDLMVNVDIVIAFVDTLWRG